MAATIPWRSHNAFRCLCRSWKGVPHHFSPSRPRQRRAFQTSPNSASSASNIPDFAFAFDIDGVLLRSATPIPGAQKALSYLQAQRVPFILLTNGGGKTEEARVQDLESKLGISLDVRLFVQSHTPFADFRDYHDKTVLVVGGEHDACRRVAQGYGFRDVVTPGDILCAYPDVWPFARQFQEIYKRFAQPLSKPINPASPEDSLRIGGIFVFNDPRDWGLDATIMLDALLSQNGIMGTVSPRNGDRRYENHGYQQDGQPPLYYSNPDLWWASAYPLNRLGQGGFQAAFHGLWNAVTNGAKLTKTIIGKPHQATYEFAERRLFQAREMLFGPHVSAQVPLKKVYMIGDNPESDIRGANTYVSSAGSKWTSVLVKTGVYQAGAQPSCRPDVILADVQEAVHWALADSRNKQETGGAE